MCGPLAQKMRILREVRRPRLLLVFPITLISVTFLASRARVAFEPASDVARWNDRESGSNSEVEKEKWTEVKSSFPSKRRKHFEKSSHAESVVSPDQPVKKYNDFERHNSKKTRVNAAGESGSPKVWSSLSICWGSNAQVWKPSFILKHALKILSLYRSCSYEIHLSDVQQGKVPICKDGVLCSSSLEKPVPSRGRIVFSWHLMHANRTL